jgi:hypothetical protein
MKRTAARKREVHGEERAFISAEALTVRATER